MSRGGRGGGAGSTVRAVANALGIQRHEMGAFQKAIVEPPPLYPVVNRSVLDLEPSCPAVNSEYMIDVKQAYLNAFHESEFYLDRNDARDIRRYRDKYNAAQRERQRLRPDFSRVPEELFFVKEKDRGQQSKKRRIEDNELIEQRLKRLEEKETEKGSDDEGQEEGSEQSEKSEKEEIEPLSDEDYAEEDNDYITTYFDNGEGYGDAGSDDNIDGDEY